MSKKNLWKVSSTPKPISGMLKCSWLHKPAKTNKEGKTHTGELQILVRQASICLNRGWEVKTEARIYICKDTHIFKYLPYCANPLVRASLHWTTKPFTQFELLTTQIQTYRLVILRHATCLSQNHKVEISRKANITQLNKNISQWQQGFSLQGHCCLFQSCSLSCSRPIIVCLLRCKQGWSIILEKKYTFLELKGDHLGRNFPSLKYIWSF